ncbi:mediator of RNA polymerase II transcription subunit 15-like [Drosophila suzukii]|uniref:Mediator of RNA polymerase II transcription subunit 15-like n=1 Tax=Drosophila suzukii TaxID=28584 RepID=A0ABM4TVT9_DROSZ
MEESPEWQAQLRMAEEEEQHPRRAPAALEEQQAQQQQQQAQQQQLNLVADKAAQQQQQQLQQQLQQEIAEAETEPDTVYMIDGRKVKVTRKDGQPFRATIVEQQDGSPVPLAVPVPAGSYPAQYASPALSSADGSPITNLHAVDVVSTPQAQVIVHKTASPQQQQHHQNLCWTKLEDDGAGQEDIKNVLQLQVKQEQRQLDFANEASTVDVSGGGENLVFNLPPGLEIKQTFYTAGVVDGEQLQSPERPANEKASSSMDTTHGRVKKLLLSPVEPKNPTDLPKLA